jgi:hypothetical protein
MQHFGTDGKISKKSATWHRHGKHRSVLMEMRALSRRIFRIPEPMYATIREAMEAAERERHRH